LFSYKLQGDWEKGSQKRFSYLTLPTLHNTSDCDRAAKVSLHVLYIQYYYKLIIQNFHIKLMLDIRIIIVIVIKIVIL